MIFKLAVLEVNFTRMELVKLKHKLLVAKKGHRLLKSKVDGLVKRVARLLVNLNELKLEVAEKLKQVFLKFEIAKIEGQSFEHVKFLIDRFKFKCLNLEVKKQNVMGVNVPVFKINNLCDFENRNNLKFLMFSSGQSLDVSVELLCDVFLKLILCIEQEKSVELLKSEIEKTRRKVNALEYLIMPNYIDTIKVIELKLEEVERDSISRLSRVKKISIES